MTRLGVHPMTVGKWRRRFLPHRVEGLRDEPRSGAQRTLKSQPEGAINAFWEQHNAAPKPFNRVKSVDDILASIERVCVHNTAAQ
jgi:transposase